MTKEYQKAAMHIVEIKQRDVICTSPVASVNVTMDGTFTEEDI